MISELERMRRKGILYSYEPERMEEIGDGVISFRGNHRLHRLEWDAVGQRWRCKCDGYKRTAPLKEKQFCEHSRAVDRIQNPVHLFQPAAAPVG